MSDGGGKGGEKGARCFVTQPCRRRRQSRERGRRVREGGMEARVKRAGR